MDGFDITEVSATPHGIIPHKETIPGIPISPQVMEDFVREWSGKLGLKITISQEHEPMGTAGRWMHASSPRAIDTKTDVCYLRLPQKSIHVYDFRWSPFRSRGFRGDSEGVLACALTHPGFSFSSSQDPSPWLVRSWTTDQGNLSSCLTRM